ncbi:hypothetical protein BH20ACI4_BH20ACI4_27320 [soil metagenome]
MKKIFFSLFLSLTFVFAASNFAEAQTRNVLFRLTETPQRISGAEKSSIASVRESEIVFNRDALRETDLSRTISIPLFDSKTYEATRTDFEFRAMDDYTWRGKIETGKFSGDVILTFKKGFVSGLIYAPEAVYEITAKGDRQILIELDQSLFPECGGEIESENENKIESSNNAIVGVDSGDRIDVIVVYTTATKNILGGDAQAQVLAQQAIDSANAAYTNSKIRQRVRLVHSQEYLYTESGNASTDLSNLRASAVIQGLRETHKADLVAMIGEVSGVCGIGYLMGSNTTGGNPNNGFTATTRSCAVGNLSFAHELGHNMGSTHNPENGSSATYPFGFGHYVNGSFRTVMSYSDPCGSGCTRRAYFSNPEISFAGFPTGIDNTRDNARSINLTADLIAAYRYSGASLTMSNYNGGEIIPRNHNRTINWSSDNLTGNVRIELSRNQSTHWETLVADTPNDGSQTINIYGKPTRKARLRIVSLDNPIVSDSSVSNVIIR